MTIEGYCKDVAKILSQPKNSWIEASPYLEELELIFSSVRYQKSASIKWNNKLFKGH